MAGPSVAQHITAVQHRTTSEGVRHGSRFDRDKALDVALAQIDKQYGKGSVMRLGDAPPHRSR